MNGQRPTVLELDEVERLTTAFQTDAPVPIDRIVEGCKHEEIFLRDGHWLCDWCNLEFVPKPVEPPAPVPLTQEEKIASRKRWDEAVERAQGWAKGRPE